MQDPTIPGISFNRHKLEDQRREAAEKEAANRRATDAQVLGDAERLIAAWNERQAKRMPMLFSPNDRCRHQSGLLVRVGAIDHANRAVTGLIFLPTEHADEMREGTSASLVRRVKSLCGTQGLANRY